MDSARSWFQKFQPRDRLRSSTRKKDSMGSQREDPKALSSEEASNLTKQRVAAAKQYIENHYKEQMRNLQERRERYGISHLNMLLTFFEKYFCIIFLYFDCYFVTQHFYYLASKILQLVVAKLQISNL